MMDSHRERDESERFPAQQLLILGLCRLAEPVAFISIVSYNFVMVTDIKGPENASFWAGLLVSAFAIAEASTAVIWGILSDRFGRKPIILIGLTGTIVSSLILGFATNYWVALFARLLGGLLNGNVGVMQTMVAEMIKNPAHEPRAYSVQPFAWSLGSIAGSALGGYTAQPARFYPQYFRVEGLFGRYPYLLPNLIASCCVFLAIVQATFFLQETNPKVKSVTAPEEPSDPDEYTPLTAGRRMSVTDAFAKRSRRLSISAGSIPTPNEPSFDMRRPSFVSVNAFNPKEYCTISEASAIDEDNDLRSESSVSFTKGFTRPVVMWIMAIALMCYHQMAFTTAFPVYLLDQPRQPPGQLDLKGGLGLNVHDVGRYMAINSFCSLFVQVFVFPQFLRRVGLWQSIVTLTLFAPLIDISIPFLTLLPNPRSALYPPYLLASFCNQIIYPSMLILLKDACPSREALGKINGMAVTASSAARCIAPPLIGLFYTLLGSAGAWWSGAAFGTLAIGELFWIPKPKKKDVEILRKASTAVADDDL